MRKSTVYLITIYMSIGAFFNMLGVLYLIGTHTHSNAEAVITMVVINVCIIAVLRDVAKYYEIKCHNRKHLARKINVGVTSRRN